MFLFDQRGPRKMYIGGVDEIVTSIWERAARREQREKERVAKKQRDEELFEKGMEEAQIEFEECDVEEETDTAEEMDTNYELTNYAHRKFTLI